VETYQALQQRLSILEGIARGEQAVAESRAVSHAQAKQRMCRWLKSSGPSQRSAILTPSPTTPRLKTRPLPRTWSDVSSRMSSSWQPRSGSLPKALGQSRYRQIIEPPCRVFYRLDGTQVLILHVMRTERLLRRDALATRYTHEKK
jgi:hypothetical protein